MIKSSLLSPKASLKLASFQRKLEPRPLSDVAYFMARFFSFSLFYKPWESGKGVGYLIIKATSLKGLGSSFRWNDADLGDFEVRNRSVLTQSLGTLV